MRYEKYTKTFCSSVLLPNIYNFFDQLLNYFLVVVFFVVVVFFAVEALVVVALVAA